MANNVIQQSGRGYTVSTQKNMQINKEPKKKGSAFHTIVSIVVWIAGVMVALAVGFGMIDGTLKIPLLPEIVTTIAGWVSVVLIILGVILAIIDRIIS